jgi:hypothetical protein
MNLKQVNFNVKKHRKKVKETYDKFMNNEITDEEYHIEVNNINHAKFIENKLNEIIEYVNKNNVPFTFSAKLENFTTLYDLSKELNDTLMYFVTPKKLSKKQKEKLNKEYNFNL